MARKIKDSVQYLASERKKHNYTVTIAPYTHRVRGSLKQAFMIAIAN